MNAPSPEQVENIHRLCGEMGLEVPEFETSVEASAVIVSLRKQRPATQRQFNKASMMVRDLVPGKAVPKGIDEHTCSELIRTLESRKPTVTMLQNLAQIEQSVGIKNPRQPYTAGSYYTRLLEARNRQGDEVIGQLIDAEDARKESWTDALVDAAHTATELQADEVEPESEGSSVMTNGRRGGAKA